MGHNYGGVRPTPFQYVPTNPKDYTTFLEQYYPDWRNVVKSGKPYPVSPGQALRAGDTGFQDGPFGSSGMFGSFDPRAIINSDPYKRLMEISRNSQASMNARNALGPSMEYARGMLQNPNPLGTGRGDIAESRGLTALHTAGDTARRQAFEESSAYGRAADPEARSFVQGLLRMKEAEGVGGVLTQAQQVRLEERAMNEEFRKSMSDALASMGLGIGSLELQEMGLQSGAAASAGQLESFARNIWAQVLSSLLSRGGGGASTREIEDIGMGRDFEKNQFRQYLDSLGFEDYFKFPSFSS